MSRKGNDANSVDIDESVVYGIVAGGDVTYIKNCSQSELIRIFERRGESIVKNLSEYYDYAPVREFLAKFSELHPSHIEALKMGNDIEAHEILCDIHRLSYDLEREEFWKKEEIMGQNIQYSIRGDAFTRGRLICEYIAGDRTTNSPLYPSITHPLYSDQLSSRYETEAPKSPYQISLETAQIEEDASMRGHPKFLRIIWTELESYREMYDYNDSISVEYFCEFAINNLSTQFTEEVDLAHKIRKALQIFHDEGRLEFTGSQNLDVYKFVD